MPIGKIEQGIIRRPDTLRRAAFRKILNVRKDSELGFVNAHARSRRAVVKLDDVKRKKFIQTAAFGVSGLVLREPVAALLEIRTLIPHRVGASDIEQIRSATQAFDSYRRLRWRGSPRGYAATHQKLDEVAHLRQRIATLVCTDNPEEESSRNPAPILPESCP